MAEPEYPIAWGVWIVDHDGPEECPERKYWGAACETEDESFEYVNNVEDEDTTATVVELIPRPVHERLVAEAVAAERERCAKIIDKAYCANTDEAMRWSRVARKIREVPS